MGLRLAALALGFGVSLLIEATQSLSARTRLVAAGLGGEHSGDGSGGADGDGRANALPHVRADRAMAQPI
jgi:hypothetical protein